MLVIIAKIVNSKGEIEAGRVFDTNSKEMKDISVGRIKEALLKDPNNRIKGFKRVEVRDYISGKVRQHINREKSNTFYLLKCPSLNGKGELHNPEEANLLVYGGWNGFAEMKKHYLYNYKGEETVADREQLIKLVKQGLVNGAIYEVDKDKLIISDDLNEEK